MAARRKEAELHAGSLLDRLIDDSVDGGAEAPSFTRLREGLRRDLEDVLNTRRRFLRPPKALAELDRSLLSYGISDFTNEELNSFTFRQDFADEVREVLHRLEPRITLDRRLRFRITGMAHLGDEREELAFDSFVDPIEGAIVVRD